MSKKTKTALVLRCCAPDMSSQSGFVWPGVGETVTCPDWVDNEKCGNGLHGWLYGQGDHSSSSYWATEGAKWLVVEVKEYDIRMLGGKCKFPAGVVRFVGARHEAAAYIVEHEPRAASAAVIGHISAVGDGQAVQVGALGSATAGYSGTATAGSWGTATAGYRGELRIRWYDAESNRYRTEIAYVGENGIKANTPYHLNDKHEFVEGASE